MIAVIFQQLKFQIPKVFFCFRDAFILVLWASRSFYDFSGVAFNRRQLWRHDFPIEYADGIVIDFQDRWIVYIISLENCYWFAEIKPVRRFYIIDSFGNFSKSFIYGGCKKYIFICDSDQCRIDQVWNPDSRLFYEIKAIGGDG